MRGKTTAHLLADARARVNSLSPQAVHAELATSDVLLVDLREPEERQEHGSIPGAIHAPRGMIEFYADPTSAYHRSEFDPDRRTILFCSSGSRSALAASALDSLGYSQVAHLDGGLRAWRNAGLPVALEPQPHAGQDGASHE
jgi:rhodanese-related sulfurtransferase